MVDSEDNEGTGPSKIRVNRSAGATRGGQSWDFYHLNDESEVAGAAVMNATSRRVFIAGAGKRDSIGTGHGRAVVAGLVRSVEAPARGIRIVEVPEIAKAVS
jgi:hypothetical protein